MHTDRDVPTGAEIEPIDATGETAEAEKDVADYLDHMAAKARLKTAPGDAVSAPPTDTTPASVHDELSQDSGASVT